MQYNTLTKPEKTALLIGMFAGDGCLPIKHNGEGYRNYQIAFYNTNKKYVTLFHNLFSQLFQIEGKIFCRKRANKKPLWRFEKYSKKLAVKFNQEFEIPFGKKALSVFVPSFIKNADLSARKHFLLGLLITDGGIRKNGTIIFHAASKKLIDDIGKLMFDIWEIKKQTKKYRQGKSRSYQISLNITESRKVLTDMPPSHNLVLRGS
ncbi:hypothetical protein KY346_00480 [Candidatus Woesearchaeota archaeon]|nr:hypothetical protein [Candidatus Woesearchaeota archaeon]